MIFTLLSALLAIGFAQPDNPLPPPPHGNAPQVCVHFQGLDISAFDPAEYPASTLSLAAKPVLQNEINNIVANSPLTGELLQSRPSISLDALQNGILDLENLDCICWPAFEFEFDMLYVQVVIDDSHSTQLYMGHFELHVPDRADVAADLQVQVVKSPGEFQAQAIMTLRYQINFSEDHSHDPIDDDGLVRDRAGSSSEESSEGSSSDEEMSESGSADGLGGSSSSSSSEEMYEDDDHHYTWVCFMFAILFSICFFSFAWCMCRSAFCSKYQQSMNRRHYVNVQEV